MKPINLLLLLSLTSELAIADDWQKLNVPSQTGVKNSVKVDISNGDNYPDVILKTHYPKPQRLDDKVFTDRFVSIIFDCRSGKMKTYKSMFWNDMTEEKVTTPWSLDYRQPTSPLEIATLNHVCGKDILGIVE